MKIGVANQEGYLRYKKMLHTYNMTDSNKVNVALRPWQVLNGQKVLRISMCTDTANEAVKVATVNMGTM